MMPTSSDRYVPIRSIPTLGTIRECETILAMLNDAQTLDDVNLAFAAFAERFGAKRMGQLIAGRGDKFDWQPVGLDYKLNGFDQEYFDRKIYETDPCTPLVKHFGLPIAWGLDEHRADDDEIIRNFYRFNDEMENPHGLTVGIQGPDKVAILGITDGGTRSDFARRVTELSPALHLFAIHVAEAIWRIRGAEPERHAPLTPRERECLSWVAVGKTAWEISCILNVSERTIVAHTENAKKKLGARTLPQAIALAVGRGLIAL
jgi:DNA-binding CsgD family transcriptional regulator